MYKSSHDIRGPLKSIIGLANISIAEKDKSKLNEYLELIKQCANSLDKTVNDILEIGKINHVSEYDKELIKFEKMISDIKTELLAGQEIAFDIKVNNSESLTFHSVTSLLKSIFQNLIENAIRYRDTGKEYCYLNIDISETQGGVEIKFSDNGIGMDDITMNKVFDMFYRHKNDNSGTGLGLYIVKLSVEKLGGKISVKSSFGIGTTFIIVLKNE
ncbi:MAG: HAMP domain-containing sensor histidine kinase [Bacteroidota bacterium]|nr:HAMP domain-containing sensor histidine kinase [Bacteroidota bacterium]